MSGFFAIWETFPGREGFIPEVKRWISREIHPSVFNLLTKSVKRATQTVYNRVYHGVLRVYIWWYTEWYAYSGCMGGIYREVYHLGYTQE